MRRPDIRIALAAASAVLALTLGSFRVEATRGTIPPIASALQPPGDLASRATIRRDRFGVPHILADTEEAAAYAHGYATAEDHGADLARLFLRARGEAASVFGPSLLEQDVQVRALRIHETAADRFTELPPYMQAVVNAYAGGYDAYLTRHPGEFPSWAKPVTGVDVLAHARAVLLLDFALNLGKWAGRSGSPGGSNVWAIGRPLSRSGGGLLLANPHLPWDGSMQFHEVQLTVPGMINVSGATFIGLPVVVIGFNDVLGWSHTVNQIDSDDVYELSVDAAGTHYSYDGLWLPLQSRTVSIEVKTDQGMETRTSTVLSAHYGPVLRTSTGQYRAFKSANLDDVNFLTQWNAMGKAGSFAAFKGALALQQLPMFNIAYADRDGSIYFLYNGRIPLRPAGFDWSDAVPGNTSKSEWFVVRPLSDLPELLNPRAGYVQNCNDGPWYTSLSQPIDKTRYAGYITSNTFGWRTILSLRILGARRDMTLEELKAYKFNAEAPFAPQLTGDLVRLARAQGGQELRDAASVLDRWDRQTNADSRGAVLYMAWFGQYFQTAQDSFTRQWSPVDPAHTPRGVSDPARAIQALTTAASAVAQAYGRLDVAWGDTHRLRRGTLDLPLRGTELTFNSVMYRPADGNTFVATGGDSYVLAVEFTSAGPRANSVLVYSESANPQSPFFNDQSRLYAAQQYKPAWFSESDIGANTIDRYHPDR
jgi:acyl-homoserine-lactone acylase